MENFLRSKEYWLIVAPGIEEPATTGILTDAQIIDCPILKTILSKETSKNI
jgi:hypothetical protein